MEQKSKNKEITVKKKTTKKQEVIDENDKIEILEKYKSLKTDKKILICLYVLIALSFAQLILPFITGSTSISSIGSSGTGASKGKYDVSAFDQISVDDMASLAGSGETHVFFFGKPSCSFCIDFIPVLKKAQEEYGYKTKYLNVEKITDTDDINKVLIYDNKEGFIAKTFGSTPMILVIKDNTLVNGWVGAGSYEEFKDFLNNSGIK